LELGTRVGDLVIEEELGRGAFGRVYRARDTLIRRVVALKVVNAVGAAPEQARILQEVRAAGKLNHPNIVTLLRVHHPNDGVWMFEMEYVAGGTLADLLQLERPMPSARALELAEGIARALEAAHQGGVVHGDVKPSNALLDQHGNVKLADFGLSRLLVDQSLSLSDLRAAGTPTYMAPEVIMGESASKASDIWSFGVVLHQLIAGRLPFDSNNLQALFYAIQNDDPALPDHPLAPLVRRCLQKQPQERPGSFEEILRGLSSHSNNAQAVAEPDSPAERVILGRAAELARLSDCMDEGIAVLVTGDAGTGKTTLVRELRRMASRRGFIWLEAAVTPLRGLLRPLLEAARDVIDSGRRARSEAFESASTAVKKLLDATSSVRVVERAETVGVLESLLQELAAETDVALAVEDAHHADAEDLRALEHLLARLPAHGVRLFITARGDDAHRLASRPGVEHVPIAALSRGDTYRHVQSLSRARRVDPEVAAHIYTVTHGNPLFTEELFRHLDGTGGIELEDGSLRPGPNWAGTSFPRRLEELCTTRLQNLSEDERSLVDIAAVDGVEIDGEVLAAVAGEPTVKVLRQLQRLYRTQGFVAPAPKGFRFTSGLFQEVVYRDIAPDLRRLLHKMIAEHLEAREARADPERIGLHWEHAGETRKAAPYLRQAAHNAASRQELSRAIDLARRGGFAPGNIDHETAAAEAELLITLADCYHGTGDPATAAEILHAVIAAATDDEPRYCAIVQQAGLTLYREGLSAEQQRDLQYAAIHLKSARWRGTALYQLGVAAKYRGELEHAEERLREADAIFRDHGLTALHSSVLDQRGSIALRRGQLEEAQRRYEEAARLAESVGRTTNAAVSRINGALATLQRGVLEGAASVLETCIADLELEGAQNLAAHAALHLARVRFAEGDFDRATRIIADAVSRMESADYALGLAPALHTQAHLAAVRGDLDVADRMLDRAGDAAQRAEASDKLSEIHALRALLRTWEGDREGARLSADKALEFNDERSAGSAAIASQLSLCWLYGRDPELAQHARRLLATRADEAASALLEGDADALRGRVGENRAVLLVVADYIQSERLWDTEPAEAMRIAESATEEARRLGHVFLELLLLRLRKSSELSAAIEGAAARLPDDRQDAFRDAWLA